MNNPIRFFTATILKWQHLLKPDKYKHVIVDSMKFLTENKRVWIYSFVVMPNHIHVLWRMKQGYEEQTVHRDFLKFTSQTIKRDLRLTTWLFSNVWFVFFSPTILRHKRTGSTNFGNEDHIRQP